MVGVTYFPEQLWGTVMHEGGEPLHVDPVIDEVGFPGRNEMAYGCLPVPGDVLQMILLNRIVPTRRCYLLQRAVVTSSG